MIERITYNGKQYAVWFTGQDCTAVDRVMVTTSRHYLRADYSQGKAVERRLPDADGKTRTAVIEAAQASVVARRQRMAAGEGA